MKRWMIVMTLLVVLMGFSSQAQTIVPQVMLLLNEEPVPTQKKKDTLDSMRLDTVLLQ